MPPRCVERQITRNDRPYRGCRGSKTLTSSVRDSSASLEGIFLKAFEELGRLGVSAVDVRLFGYGSDQSLDATIDNMRRFRDGVLARI